MSAQPSEKAMRCAREWQGHQFNCNVYIEDGRPDSECSCIVRKLALSIDSAIREAVEEEREACAGIVSRNAICRGSLREALAKIRARSAQEGK